MNTIKKLYSKSDLHHAFEREAGKWFDEPLEWNGEKGYYADPRTRIMFHVFCEGYGYCVREKGEDI